MDNRGERGRCNGEEDDEQRDPPSFLLERDVAFDVRTGLDVAHYGSEENGDHQSYSRLAEVAGAGAVSTTGGRQVATHRASPRFSSATSAPRASMATALQD